jgi:hypothetical protein
VAQLINKVKQAIDINFEKVTLWSDSTIVLSWIRSHSNKIKTFVSHRVAEIQDLSNPTDWRHVPTDENSADGISRYLMPDQLPHSILRWSGPAFFRQSENCWPDPSFTFIESELPEMKITTTLVQQFENNVNSMITKQSSLFKMKRIVAYILWLINNCRKSRQDRCFSHITVEELVVSMKCIVCIIQKQEFSEYSTIQKGESLSKQSQLKSLNVFIDSDLIT